MKRSKLNSAERATFRSMEAGILQLKYDYRRRLRNALRALRRSDPKWRPWCKRHLRKGMAFKEMAERVERRARRLVLKRFRFAGIHDHDNWWFNDDGSLSPG